MVLEQETFIVVTVILFTVVSTVIGFMMKIWPMLTFIVNTVKIINGDKNNKSLVSRLENIEKTVKTTDFNTKPNHGSSAHDKLFSAINNVGQRIDKLDIIALESEDDRRILHHKINRIVKALGENYHEPKDT